MGCRPRPARNATNRKFGRKRVKRAQGLEFNDLSLSGSDVGHRADVHVSLRSDGSRRDVESSRDLGESGQSGPDVFGSEWNARANSGHVCLSASGEQPASCLGKSTGPDPQSPPSPRPCRQNRLRKAAPLPRRGALRTRAAACNLQDYLHRGPPKSIAPPQTQPTTVSSRRAEAVHWGNIGRLTGRSWASVCLRA